MKKKKDEDGNPIFPRDKPGPNTSRGYTLIHFYRILSIQFNSILVYVTFEMPFFPSFYLSGGVASALLHCVTVCSVSWVGRVGLFYQQARENQ